MASDLAVDPEAPPQEADGPARPGRWRRLRPEPKDALALLAFVVLTILLFRSAWRSPATTWIGSAGDPPFFMWHLRWLPHALAEGQNPLFTTHLNYPDGVNLMWNTNLPLLALLLSPLTLTIGPIFAYNVLVTTAVALSGGCAYLMLRRYVASRSAAFVGGLLYGFSPYIYSHANEHPNLAAAFVPPLLLLLLDEILVRQKRSPVTMGLLLGGLTFGQLMISEEMLATEALVAGVGLVLLMALHPRRVVAHARYAATAVGLGLVLALTLAGAPLLFQFYGARAVRTGALWGPDIFVSDLLGFVIPTAHLRFNPAWTEEVTKNYSDACCPSEWSTYLGLPLILLMTVVTARLWSRPLVRLAGLLAGATAVLAMGPKLHVRGLVTSLTLPFSKVASIPVLHNILSERLMLYVYLMAAILVAVAVDHVFRDLRRPGLAAGLAAFALVPLLPNFQFPATTAPAPAFFRSGAVHRIPKDSVVLVAPFARDTSTSGPMLWQAEADMRYRMPEGYILGPDRSGRFSYLPVPTPLSKTMEEIQRGAPLPTLDPTTRRLLVDDLTQADVHSVVVGPMQNRETMITFFRLLLGTDPTSVGGVALWTGVDPARLRQ